MPDLQFAQAQQPFRVTAFFASFTGSQLSPEAYTLARGGVVAVEIEAAWQRSGGAIELALVEPLLVGERYTLAHTGASNVVELAYIEPVSAPTAAGRLTLQRGAEDDPEAEAFGVDVDWFAAGLTPSGDLPAVRGLAALKHDLAALAVLNPGELLHRPAAGLGLSRRVNGAASAGARAELEADARAAYLADTRVKDASITITSEGERTVLRASVTTPPLSREALDLAVRLS